MTNHYEAADGSNKPMSTMSSPAELADALPYLMGFHPDDSVVLVAKHGMGHGFGGRVRLGIPDETEDWPLIAEQLVACLVTGSERHLVRPAGVVIYLCQDPRGGEAPQQVMERLRPLAEALLVACGSQGVTVEEALCLSAGRYWSYVCVDARCCPPAGTPMALPGTSVAAAAATYAGLHMHGSLRQMEARFAPPRGAGAASLKSALDAAASALVPRMVLDDEGDQVAEETLAAAARVMERLREAPPSGGAVESDRRDDQLIGDREGADLLLGLQVRETRDRAAEWMEGEEAALALRLWRALARRCVAPYMEFATAPLSLAGWVAWSLDDEPEARVALGLALDLDPVYTFAQLLHRACNQGLDVEEVRRCLRDELHGAHGPAHKALSKNAAQAPACGRGTQLALPHEQSSSRERKQGCAHRRSTKESPGAAPDSTGAPADPTASGQPQEFSADQASPRTESAEAANPSTRRPHPLPRAVQGQSPRPAVGSRARRRGRPRPVDRISPQLPRQLRRNLCMPPTAKPTKSTGGPQGRTRRDGGRPQRSPVRGSDRSRAPKGGGRQNGRR
ncbi:DUF4192 domain-containing protein [Streptomyces sp. LHD-70]|uniref:DUF4192 domain-containing protein n=1 Tax=Streptomyces sp. LHD-70 TaxID=3072140 RepID=UPI00280FFFFE|nr:DUF4192 domain-containing protein [Streptomyces sp. LHD-70]MDQ8703495.1 DUF4192 domain-containing protein [Streptomyces sp. LHD-70]